MFFYLTDQKGGGGKTPELLFSWDMGVSCTGVQSHSFERDSAVPLPDVGTIQLGALVCRFIVIVTVQR